ncbi:MAG: DUF523 domain-containing protein [Desulfobacter sp.]|nr:DUF523 domain-containing protein [Desulfobacter sp.]WDP87611.1 MAG: DUF523 domain-containing protein [Desulfobacter sp.]
MEKILISACLLGAPVRYDGASKPFDHPLIQKWKNQGRLVPFCPEVAGGLPTPRPPAEIFRATAEDFSLSRAKVLTRKTEVTQAFVRGARAALDLALAREIQLALLKEKSPSCGSSFVYDGSFSGRRVPGMGITTALLREYKIHVFSENQIEDLCFLLK